jgi:hypothetical protein
MKDLLINNSWGFINFMRNPISQPEKRIYTARDVGTEWRCELVCTEERK